MIWEYFLSEYLLFLANYCCLVIAVGVCAAPQPLAVPGETGKPAGMLSLPWGLQLAGEAGDGLSLPRLCIVCLLSLAWSCSTGKSSTSQPTPMLLTPWNVGIQLSRIPCLPVGGTARTTSMILPRPSSSSWSSPWSTSGTISLVEHIPSWILGGGWVVLRSTLCTGMIPQRVLLGSWFFPQLLPPSFPLTPTPLFANGFANVTVQPAKLYFIAFHIVMVIIIVKYVFWDDFLCFRWKGGSAPARALLVGCV